MDLAANLMLGTAAPKAGNLSGGVHAAKENFGGLLPLMLTELAPGADDTSRGAQTVTRKEAPAVSAGLPLQPDAVQLLAAKQTKSSAEMSSPKPHPSKEKNYASGSMFVRAAVSLPVPLVAAASMPVETVIPRISSHVTPLPTQAVSAHKSVAQMAIDLTS